MASSSFGLIRFLILVCVRPAVEKVLSGAMEDGRTVLIASSRNVKALPFTPLCSNTDNSILRVALIDICVEPGDWDVETSFPFRKSYKAAAAVLLTVSLGFCRPAVCVPSFCGVNEESWIRLVSVSPPAVWFVTSKPTVITSSLMVGSGAMST